MEVWLSGKKPSPSPGLDPQPGGRGGGGGWVSTLEQVNTSSFRNFVYLIFYIALLKMT